MLMILMIHLGKWVILLKKKEGGGLKIIFSTYFLHDANSDGLHSESWKLSLCLLYNIPG